MRKPTVGYQFISKLSFLAVNLSLFCVVSTNIALNQHLFPCYVLWQHAVLLVIDGKLLVKCFGGAKWKYCVSYLYPDSIGGGIL